MNVFSSRVQKVSSDLFYTQYCMGVLPVNYAPGLRKFNFMQKYSIHHLTVINTTLFTLKSFLSLLPLLIHHSPHPQLPHSFTFGIKPTWFTNASHRRFFPPSGLTPQTLNWTAYFWTSVSVSVSLPYSSFLFSVPCAQLSWLMWGFKHK